MTVTSLADLACVRTDKYMSENVKRILFILAVSLAAIFLANRVKPIRNLVYGTTE